MEVQPNKFRNFKSVFTKTIVSKFISLFKRSDLTLEEWARLEGRPSYQTRAPKRDTSHERVL